MKKVTFIVVLVLAVVFFSQVAYAAGGWLDGKTMYLAPGETTNTQAVTAATDGDLETYVELDVYQSGGTGRLDHLNYASASNMTIGSYRIKADSNELGVVMYNNNYTELGRFVLSNANDVVVSLGSQVSGVRRLAFYNITSAKVKIYEVDMYESLTGPTPTPSATPTPTITPTPVPTPTPTPTLPPTPPPLQVNFIGNKTSLVVQIMGGSPPYTIDWLIDQAVVNANTYTITGLEANTVYTVIVTDSEGESVISSPNTGNYDSFVPPTFPSPGGIFQEMVDNFGLAGTIAIAVIGAAVALGLIVILGLWGWRLTKKWLSAAK